jgi:hypothetical protein
MTDYPTPESVAEALDSPEFVRVPRAVLEARARCGSEDAMRPAFDNCRDCPADDLCESGGNYLTTYGGTHA